MKVVLEIIVLLVRVLFCYLLEFVGLFYKRKKDLAGKTAVLTGGGGGIGRFIALELAKRKVKLAIWDVNKAAADKVRHELLHRGFNNVFTCQCDITDREDVKKAATETRKILGKVDFLFNNAGVLFARDILGLSEEEIRKTIEVNCISQFWTIKEFLPSMLENNYGHIINTASMAGKLGSAWLSDYCASKFAVVGLSDSVRDDITRRGKDVKVTVICPTMVNTSMVSNTRGHTTPYARFDKFEEPDAAGKAIVEGMERNAYIVYVPPKMFFVGLAATILPVKVKIILDDFLKVGYFPRNKKME